MDVREVMTRQVECISPNTSLSEAARKMRDLDVGPMPVCEGDQVIGIITDRDIAIRAVAEGMDPNLTTASEIMTRGVSSCFEDQSVGEAASLMQDKQIRRLVVLNHDGQLVGIVSLGDLAVRSGDDERSGETLERISEPARSL